MRLPKGAHYCFWSYDISKIDVKEDARLIIQQILNYGDWRMVKWLFTAYDKRTIMQVLRSPSRGMWWPRVLNFWHTVLKLHIPKDTYALAIKEIDPARADRQALSRFFTRAEQWTQKKNRHHR